jgi:CRISPR-associated exonuclease Cas4
MWSSSDYITPLDIKQYVYCPMIPWLIHNFHVREPETYSMENARQIRALRLQSIQNLVLEPPVRVEFPMRSPELRLRGTADIVSGSKQVTVVEVKAYKRHEYNHFKWQLFAYTLLSEKTVGPTKKAILVLGEKTHTYEVTLETLDATRRLVDKTLKVVESEKPPQTSPSAKCSSCWYKRYCPVF